MNFMTVLFEAFLAMVFATVIAYMMEWRVASIAIFSIFVTFFFNFVGLKILSVTSRNALE